MSTILYTGTYLDGLDAFGGSRLQRNMDYIKYYWPLREELGFEKIILADNGSSKENLDAFEKYLFEGLGLRAVPLYPGASAPVQILAYKDHLGFVPGMSYGYKYCWRTLWTVRNLITMFGATKVILLDSDMYILTKRLADWVKSFDNGWGTVWCARHNFPEAAFQIIAGDGIEQFLEYTDGPWEKHLGERMETTLPFSLVEKGFIGDRYGEAEPANLGTPDYYGQALVGSGFKSWLG